MKRQSLTVSHIITPSSSNPKQTPLYLKQQQIKKKLSKLESKDQLQKLYNLIKTQNDQLVKDLTVLKQHLAQVQDKKKIQSSRISNNNKLESSVAAIMNSSTTEIDLSNYPPEMVSTYETNKKQLQQQYKLMQYLKCTLSQLQQQLPTQQVTQHKHNKMNELKQIQQQIIQNKQKLKVLLKDSEHLELTMKQNQTKDNLNIDSVKLYQQQNSSLKKQISDFKQQGYKHQYKAVNVIDQIYKKKSILTHYQTNPKPNTLLSSKHLQQNYQTNQTNPNTFFKRTKSVSNTLSKPHSSNSPITIESSHIDSQLKQITELKQKVQQLSIEDLKHKQQQKKQKQNLLDLAKKLHQQFKNLQKTKTKKVVELNHLKAKIQIIAKEKQLKQKNKIITNNFALQEDGFTLDMIKQPLRRDFIGIVGQKSRFDDRMFLKQKKRTFIKGVIIYENDNNLSAKGSIVAIRAIYTDAETNQLNFTPLPGQYLQKCKMQRLELPQDDFLKLIKVKYNNLETRVTKIEIRSNRNLKYEFGEKKAFQEVSQNESVYAFDIGLNEFPVSMFGSFCQFRNSWYLESFGVQINTLT